MKNTKLQFLVGLFVLLGIGAITYLTLKVGTGSLIQGETYKIESRFSNTGGLHSGSSVLMSGVTVGRVEDVRMEPSDFSAIVTMKITSALHLPTDTMASIKTAGLIGDKYVALLSGLSVGDPNSKGLTLQLALDWLSGNLSSGGDRDLASRVVRCIIAGNLVSVLDAPTGNVAAKDAHKLTGALREVDAFLCQLASALPVDVMPGRDDPSSVALPQHPLHRCLLPESCRYEATLHRVYNPHECDIDGIRFLGTSGQNVDDLWRCCATEDRLALLEASLRWGHMVPTAPDTLSCHPYNNSDPFVIYSQPHVYFAGNQAAYGTALVQAPCEGGGTATTRLVLVPSFTATGTLVLVNLTTLACHPVTFSAAT